MISLLTINIGSTSNNNLNNICRLVKSALQDTGAVPSECQRFASHRTWWSFGPKIDPTWSTIAPWRRPKEEEPAKPMLSFQCKTTQFTQARESQEECLTDTVLALSGPNSDLASQNCTFKSTSLLGEYPSSGLPDDYDVALMSSISGTIEKDNFTSYDHLVQNVTPILTLIFPSINDSIPHRYDGAMASMLCVRASKNIKAGSRVPTPLPPPLSLDKTPSTNLVPAATGTVALVLLLSGFAVWIFFRTRRETRIELEERSKERADLEAEKENLRLEGITPMIDGVSRMELPAVLRVELNVENMFESDMRAMPMRGELDSWIESPIIGRYELGGKGSCRPRSV